MGETTGFRKPDILELNFYNFQSCLRYMEAMKNDWEGRKLTVPELEGEGAMPKELAAITQLYEELHTSLMALFTDTQTLLTGVEQEFRQAEWKAKGILTGGGK